MKQQLQVIFAFALCLAGVVLIFIGLFIQPVGEIHYSVLVAFGEILTFSGSLLGIDYRYRYKPKE